MSTQTQTQTTTEVSLAQSLFLRSRKFFVFGIVAVLVACLGFSVLSAASITSAVTTIACIVVLGAGLLSLLVGLGIMSKIVEKAIKKN